MLRRPFESAQYAAEVYTRQLASMKVEALKSLTGCRYDNAPMEAFFYSLKVELVHQRRWATREGAWRDLFGYIKG